ncbi:glutamate racemase [Parerythrobacter jejuensis]|uniref:Glutamate racemase n=1 Tax=Parerythrobacter jejuensis TaxID=795812 RepID=A0A845ARJ5_9SPHN|nr:glutamate racemase [Parerythrobacter jejuensis]MXP32109.1 glutamate racemase [Parerythrobacter jejuensis]
MAQSVDPTAPILILDSGLGGLTVLGEIRQILPTASLIYAADYAGLPYGTKSEAEVAARVCGLLGRMSERYKPRAICIACNTASTIALEMVRDVLEVPIVGTVPAIKPAAAITRTGTIGLLGTAATIRQPYVDRLEADFAADKRLVRHAAPGLVDLAEAKLRGDAVDPMAIRSEVSGLLEADGASDIDTVVLACTHFPLLEAELAEVFGPEVQFVHGAAGIARRMATVVHGQQFAPPPHHRAVTTGEVARLHGLAPLFARFGFETIEQF